MFDRISVMDGLWSVKSGQEWVTLVYIVRAEENKVLSCFFMFTAHRASRAIHSVKMVEKFVEWGMPYPELKNKACVLS